jgi:hypothetical protein
MICGEQQTQHDSIMHLRHRLIAAVWLQRFDGINDNNINIDAIRVNFL